MHGAAFGRSQVVLVLGMRESKSRNKKDLAQPTRRNLPRKTRHSTLTV